MSITVVDFEAARASRASTAPRSKSVGRTRGGRASTGVRLTRRGRVVLLVGALSLALALFTFLGAPAASTDRDRHVPATTVVVQPGQTLWEIAQSVAPQEDPREVIAAIVELNALSDTGAIRAGQPLYVPVP